MEAPPIDPRPLTDAEASAMLAQLLANSRRTLEADVYRILTGRAPDAPSAEPSSHSETPP